VNESALDGAVALVTGADSAIGSAAAKRLAVQGVAVALVACGPDRLSRVVREIAAMGGHAVAVDGDITHHDRAYGVVQDTLDRFGRLDILVNSAEVMLLSSALRSPLEEWDRMVALNVTGLLHVTHAAIPYLIDAAATSPRQVADLVNVGSSAGRAARTESSVYTLTKLGLTGFTESLRRELLGDGVRVSIIEPGMDAEPINPLDFPAPAAASPQPAGIERSPADDIADGIAYIVTRERGVAVDRVLMRAGQRT
jgi:NADP-dependent 3-hydroxy acid dehydrogenase YdfG